MQHTDTDLTRDLESKDPVADRTRYQPLKDAIDTLAAVCDGAHKRDDKGFNGPDAPLGHLLAFLPLVLWPPETLYQAWEMLRKYRSQLAFHGIVSADLPEPPYLEQEQGTRYIARKEAGEFLVLFSSNDKLERAFARLPGGEKRTTPARYHLVQPIPGAGRPLLAFATRHAFVWAPHVKVQARLIDYQVLWEEQGMLSVYFPRDEEMNAEIKAIPGWWYAYRPRFHWLIPSNLESLQAFRAFLARHPEFQLSDEVRQHLLQVSGGIHHTAPRLAQDRELAYPHDAR